jgi:hypothetical protein
MTGKTLRRETATNWQNRDSREEQGDADKHAGPGGRSAQS